MLRLTALAHSDFAAVRTLPLPLVLPAALAVLCLIARVLPLPLAIETQRIILEAALLATAALLFLHAHANGVAGLYFGAGLFYGTILENAGLNVGYFHEDAMKSALIPGTAPLAIIGGWSFVLYMAVTAASRLKLRSPLCSALAAASFALVFDLALDPLATELGAWVWTPSLPHAFGGVPVMNYVTWFVVVGVFAFVIFRSPARPWDRSRVLRLAIASPLLLAIAAVFVGLALVIAEGIASPTLAMLDARVRDSANKWASSPRPDRAIEMSSSRNAPCEQHAHEEDPARVSPLHRSLRPSARVLGGRRLLTVPSASGRSARSDRPERALQRDRLRRDPADPRRKVRLVPRREPGLRSAEVAGALRGSPSAGLLRSQPARARAVDRTDARRWEPPADAAASERGDHRGRAGADRSVVPRWRARP